MNRWFWRRRRFWFTAIALVAIVAVIGTGAVYWVRQNRTRREHFAAVQSLLDLGRYNQALSQTRRCLAEGIGDPDFWGDSEFRALVGLKRLPELAYLHRRHPERFENREEGSLLAARGLAEIGDSEGSQKLIETWKPQATRPVEWEFIEIDRCIRAGELTEARRRLKHLKAEGIQEANRLTRLAILTLKDDPAAAWDHLDAAYRAAPHHGEVRVFRGQFLEQMNRFEGARLEYIAAQMADPKNPSHIDQLAEFYRRRGNLSAAAEVLSDGANAMPTPLLRLKSWFWTRITGAGSMRTEAGDSEADGLFAYLEKLPAGQFWNEPAFRRLANHRTLAQSRPEIFWLRLLELLRRGEEDDALRLVGANPFRTASMAPRLEAAILQVLRFRKTGYLGTTTEIPPSDGRGPAAHHQIFDWLDRMRLPPDTKDEVEARRRIENLLRGPDAFAVLFMTAGWLEAGLTLKRMDVYPDDYPTWVSYGVAQAIRYRRGPAEAAAFAARQPESPSLNLLRGELQLSCQRTAEALAFWEPLRTLATPEGERAAWLSALVQFDKGQTEAVRRIVGEQPRLAAAAHGVELLARASIREGRDDIASQLYRSIKDRSVEAKAFLARKAFSSGNWTESLELTLELAESIPDHLRIRANLAAIQEAKKK